MYNGSINKAFNIILQIAETTSTRTIDVIYIIMYMTVENYENLIISFAYAFHYGTLIILATCKFKGSSLHLRKRASYFFARGTYLLVDSSHIISEKIKFTNKTVL